MALNGFAPSSFAFVAATDAVKTLAIAGAPTNVLISNVSPSATAFVNFGATVAENDGVAVLPNQSIVLTVGSNTELAYIGAGALLNIAFGD